jgi:hypothetical protein
VILESTSSFGEALHLTIQDGSSSDEEEEGGIQRKEGGSEYVALEWDEL